MPSHIQKCEDQIEDVMLQFELVVLDIHKVLLLPLDHIVLNAVINQKAVHYKEKTGIIYKVFEYNFELCLLHSLVNTVCCRNSPIFVEKNSATFMQVS